MKTVEMDRDFDHIPIEQVTVSYKSGMTYTRVPNAHADAIVAAGAGRVTQDHADEAEAKTEGAEPRRGRR